IQGSGRRWVKDKAETLWIWLSYQRTWPYVRRLQSGRAVEWIFLIVVGLFLAGSLTIILVCRYADDCSSDSKEDLDLLMTAYADVGMGLAAVVFYFVARNWWLHGFRWIMQGGAAWKFVLRALFGCFCLALFGVIMLNLGGRLIEVLPAAINLRVYSLNLPDLGELPV